SFLPSIPGLPHHTAVVAGGHHGDLERELQRRGGRLLHLLLALRAGGAAA
uniref:Uncharacterized protein n=1 Tax=Aegilops tauschii subsp. strangulata TaxID=200361 RepID=A0A453DRM6_AEGTS